MKPEHIRADIATCFFVNAAIYEGCRDGGYDDAHNAVHTDISITLELNVGLPIDNVVGAIIDGIGAKEPR